jgi:uncharacterized protein YndB with AHSA1/START domain
MSSVKNGITIGRSIEDVFAVMTDLEKTGLWFRAPSRSARAFGPVI